MLSTVSEGEDAPNLWVIFQIARTDIPNLVFVVDSKFRPMKGTREDFLVAQVANSCSVMQKWADVVSWKSSQ